MSRPETRGSPDRAMAPWIATERLFERGTHATLTMGTAVGRAMLDATRRQVELLGASAGMGSKPAGRAGDGRTDARERAATARRTAATGKATGEATEEATEELVEAYVTESAFDRFLDTSAPFGHPAVDDRR